MGKKGKNKQKFKQTKYFVLNLLKTAFDVENYIVFD